MKQFAPAKINLYLHIVGKRPDGFHELEMLMVPISLGDEIEIELIPENGGSPIRPTVEFTCSVAELSNAKENLACRAAELFFQEFKIKQGARIHLEKRVPFGAGLGGGSSDAAAVLLALRKLCPETKASDEKLKELAAQLGSDVPFFIYGKSAICRGRGEIIEPKSLQGKYQGLLVHPGFGVPTPWAYKTYAQNPSKGVEGKKMEEGFILRNDLEPAAFSKYLWLPTAKKWFQEQPEVLDALMSGSGSSIFALVKNRTHTCDLEKRFKAGFGQEMFTTPFQIQYESL